MKKRPIQSRPARDGAWGLALFCGLLLLNASLVSPYIGWYDSGEMVGATVCLGISHPSGQALFHLLGKLFLLFPFETPAYRLGFMSAAFSALASVFFWILACRLAERVTGAADHRLSPALKRWLALLTIAWSLSQPWWRYSLTPLVYALHLLLGLLLLWVLSLDKPGKWFLVFFILGMATVFRPTQFFALPFVGLAFLWEGVRYRKHSVKALLMLIPFWGLGQSTALYLPLRSALHPAIAYADLTHPLALVRHVLAMKFSKYVGTVSVSTILGTSRQMLAHFWNDLTPLGVALLLWGVALVYGKRAKIPIFFWVALGWGMVESLFVFTIPFPTFESHQVLLGWVYSGWLAVLPLALVEGLLKRGVIRPVFVDALLGAFLLIQVSQVGHFWDRKREKGAEDFARNVLTIMKPNALYVPYEENEYFPVAGYQQSYGFRKDVGIVEPGMDPSLVAPQIHECLNQNRPLYVTRQWALPPGWSYQGWGPLMTVVPDAVEENSRKAPAVKPLVAWGGIELQGVDLWPPRVRPGDVVEINYRWVRRKASPQDSSDMVVGVFIDPKGNYWMKNGVFWLHDIHEAPTGGLAQLKPGSLLEDNRILFVPSDFPPGNYALTVGLQKKLPPLEMGKESFNREFYERNGYQNLDKFMGRGESDAVVQFSTAASDSWKDGLWPVTRSLYPIADPRFVPVAELQISAMDGHP
jgi:hypothetical protein